MLSAISKLDSFIQRCVDAAAFAVMRTCGVRKSFVRYATYLSIVGLLAVRAALAKHWLYLIVGLIWLAVAEFAKRHDEASERAGMISRLDSGSNFLKGYWWMCTLLEVAALHWLALCTNILFLGTEYLRRTPSEPPATKQSSTSLNAVPEAG